MTTSLPTAAADVIRFSPDAGTLITHFNKNATVASIVTRDAQIDINRNGNSKTPSNDLHTINREF